MPKHISIEHRPVNACSSNDGLSMKMEALCKHNRVVRHDTKGMWGSGKCLWQCVGNIDVTLTLKMAKVLNKRWDVVKYQDTQSRKQTVFLESAWENR